MRSKSIRSFIKVFYVFLFLLLMVNSLSAVSVSYKVPSDGKQEVSRQITIRNIILLNQINSNNINYKIVAINKLINIQNIKKYCALSHFYNKKVQYKSPIMAWLTLHELFHTFRLYQQKSVKVIMDKVLSDGSKIKIVKTEVYIPNLQKGFTAGSATLIDLLERSFDIYSIKYVYNNITIYIRIYLNPTNSAKTLFYSVIFVNNKEIIDSNSIDMILGMRQTSLIEYLEMLANLIIKIYSNTKYSQNVAEALLKLSSLLKKNPNLAHIKGKAIGIIAPTSLKCDICNGLVWALCFLLSQGVADWAACGMACTLVCAEWGWGAFICFGVCYTICDTVLYWILLIGVGAACGAGGSYVCHLALGC